MDSELSRGQIKFSTRGKQRRTTVTAGLRTPLLKLSHADHYCLTLPGGVVGKSRRSDNIYVRLFSRVRGSTREAPNGGLLGAEEAALPSSLILLTSPGASRVTGCSPRCHRLSDCSVGYGIW